MTEYNSMTDKAPTVAVIGLGMLISKTAVIFVETSKFNYSSLSYRGPWLGGHEESARSGIRCHWL